MIADLIEAHRAAVAADEASFDDDGNALDAAAAEATAKTEMESYLTLVAARCQSSVDVQAKLLYFLEPPPGNRESNINALSGEDGEVWNPAVGPRRLIEFLRSLVIVEPIDESPLAHRLIRYFTGADEKHTPESLEDEGLDADAEILRMAMVVAQKPQAAP